MRWLLRLSWSLGDVVGCSRQPVPGPCRGVGRTVTGCGRRRRISSGVLAASAAAPRVLRVDPDDVDRMMVRLPTASMEPDSLRVVALAAEESGAWESIHAGWPRETQTATRGRPSSRTVPCVNSAAEAQAGLRFTQPPAWMGLPSATLHLKGPLHPQAVQFPSTVETDHHPVNIVLVEAHGPRGPLRGGRRGPAPVGGCQARRPHPEPSRPTPRQGPGTR